MLGEVRFCQGGGGLKLREGVIMLRGGVVCCLKIGLGNVICFVGGGNLGMGGGGSCWGEGFVEGNNLADARVWGGGGGSYGKDSIWGMGVSNEAYAPYQLRSIHSHVNSFFHKVIQHNYVL